MKINKYPYKDETFPTWEEYILYDFDNEKEKHFKKLSENELKKVLRGKLDEIKKWRSNKDQELAFERKKKREEREKEKGQKKKDKTLKKSLKVFITHGFV